MNQFFIHRQQGSAWLCRYWLLESGSEELFVLVRTTLSLLGQSSRNPPPGMAILSPMIVPEK